MRHKACLRNARTKVSAMSPRFKSKLLIRIHLLHTLHKSTTSEFVPRKLASWHNHKKKFDYQQLKPYPKKWVRVGCMSKWKWFLKEVSNYKQALPQS